MIHPDEKCTNQWMIINNKNKVENAFWPNQIMATKIYFAHGGQKKFTFGILPLLKRS